VITPDEALGRILALATPVKIEVCPLINATGRWTAAPVLARRTQPARDLSAMDGYAIRWAERAGPWQIVGESAAGAPFNGAVGPGDAVRIFTGAALPDGADSIIIQEDVARDADRVTRRGDGPHAAGAHIRRAGADFSTGQTLVASGDRLTPARIGLAAIGGRATLAVRRRIRLAIISTGDELAPIGADAGMDHLPASNAAMIAAMLADMPVDVTDLGIIRDDCAALAAAFAQAADYDVMVSTGGVSVGDHDLVRPALIHAGATIDFWKIAMRPGKPLMAGRLGNAVALGLPGNPVSAFVTATLFLKPLIAHLSGAADPAPPTMTARLASALPAVDVRTDYVRARWEDGALAPLTGDSGMLVPLAVATALIIRPGGSPPASKGDDVTALMLT
jgi:molybdopterin molybdotransferase